MYFPLKENNFRKLVELDDLLKVEVDTLFINFEEKTQKEKKIIVSKHHNILMVKHRKVLKISERIGKFALKVNKFVFWSYLQGLSIAYVTSVFFLNLGLFL